MRIFAISDLHLPAREKPMDVFGPHWENHFERISASWRDKVAAEDVVLLPGDLTWAMRLEDAMEDLRRVGELPGRKIILRGNHDYWWSGVGQVRRALPEGMFALQNDAMELDGVLFAGSRGWTLPGQDATREDEKIYLRERIRLEMSLKAARRLSEEKPLYVMMHYPPFSPSCEGYSDLIRVYGAQMCVYGHLHGGGLSLAFNGEKDGVVYRQVSCDGLGFRVRSILPDEETEESGTLLP